MVRRNARALVLGTIAAALGAAAPAGAAITATPSSDATALAQHLAGPGVNVFNAQLTAGAVHAAGTFSDSGPVAGFPEGVLLSSGDIRELNPGGLPDIANFGPGDPELDAIVNGGTLDATVLQFDFTTPGKGVTFNYTFGSREYPRYIATDFNDVFAFFVNGKNCALIPTTGEPVSIDTVHAGKPSDGIPPKNPEFFRENYQYDKLPTELGGLTTVLKCNAQVAPGAVNHMKLAIADRGDMNLDSVAFLQGNSFVPDGPPTAALAAGAPQGSDVLFDTTGTGDAEGALASWTLEYGDGTSDSGTGNPPTTIGHTYGAPGTYTATLTVVDSAQQPATATATVTIDRVATVLIAEPAIAKVSGLKIYLNPSATLKTSSGAPVGGRTIRFTDRSGREICRAGTGGNGYAKCSGLLPLVSSVLSLGYRAHFDGDALFKPAADDGELIR